MGRISLATAARSLEQLVDDVADNTSRVTITYSGKPIAVLISVAELESMEEKLYGLCQPGIDKSAAETETGLPRHRTFKDKVKARFGLGRARHP
jgi:prevent-host-death family protein